MQDEKDKLSGQVQKLSTDLDLCREQIASKNKVNLKVSHLKIKKKNIYIIGEEHGIQCMPCSSPIIYIFFLSCQLLYRTLLVE